MWAIVPVKPLELSKGRLAPSLSPTHRRRLQIALLTDLLEVLGSLEQLTGVLVVTSDPEARRLATEHGASCLDEPRGDAGSHPESGLNAALVAAFAEVTRRGGRAALVLPGDLPIAPRAELHSLLAALPTSDRAVAVVADRHGDGTNVLFCRPPGIVEPAFGKRSAATHLARAGSAGATVVRLDFPSLSLDLDTPEDLLELERRGAASARVAAVLAHRHSACTTDLGRTPPAEPEPVTGDTP